MKNFFIFIICMIIAALIGAGVVYVNTDVRLGLISLGLVALLALLLSLYIFWDYRRHRKPLALEDPKVPYTVGHHIRQVTIPLFRYRLSFMLRPKNGAIKRF